MEVITTNRYIEVICPVCKAKRVIQIPKSVVNQASQLTTISVPQGKVCQHHFQLFIDKNFSIRGYQKVDFQVNPGEIKKDKRLKPTYKDHFVNSLDLYQSNNSEDNSSKIIPEKPNYQKRTSNFEENFNKKNNMTLQEIYEEFWEFIDDNNEVFRRFIIKDKNRRMQLKMRALTPQ
jgi:translation elongation factor EF-4